MKCEDIQYWIISRDVFTDKEPPEILDHLKFCESCRMIYDLDSGLEKSIRTAFVQTDLPVGLSEQIASTIDHTKRPVMVNKKGVAGLVMSVALMLVAAYMVLSNKPPRYENLQQLSEEAVVRHLKKDMTMSFDAGDVEQASAMLSKELNFKVIIPDLADKGYVLLGGRLCVLSRCRIAYLFYEKQDKTCSLFIMDYDHLDFQLADGSRFSNDVKGCHTDIWKDKGQVYAMVY